MQEPAAANDPQNISGGKSYPAVLREEHVIRAHECGEDHLLKFHVLLDYLQDIAATHAELLDVGLSALTEHGILWVLSRLKLEIFRYPACDEKITLLTYPSGVNTLFATREYLMADEKGAVLVKGTSFWLVIDGKSHRPVKASAVLPPGMPINEDKDRFFPELGKIARRTVVPDLPFTVRHGDIDMNCHLNNALFARNVLDCLCSKKGKKLAARTIQLNFVGAGALGETLCFGSEILENGSFYAEAVSPDGKKLYIQAEGTLFPF